MTLIGVSVINIQFSSGDSLLRTTRDAYIELASEADQQLALRLHQTLYRGNCINGMSLIPPTNMALHSVIALCLSVCQSCLCSNF